MDAESMSETGSERGCTLLGLICLAAGAYLLVGNPSAAGADVVNLQRLYLGQTAAIVGSIFLAAAWRPRLTPRLHSGLNASADPSTPAITGECHDCRQPLTESETNWYKGKRLCGEHFDAAIR